MSLFSARAVREWQGEFSRFSKKIHERSQDGSRVRGYTSRKPLEKFMRIVKVQNAQIESTKADLQNWLSFYSAPLDRLPSEEVLVQALALETLAAEMRSAIASKITSFELAA
jgi:hypothetical protein